MMVLATTAQDKWKAPPEADKLKNPVAGREVAIKGG